MTALSSWRTLAHAMATIICLGPVVGCGQDWDEEPDPYDLDFDVPRSHAFAEALSAHELFEEPLAALQPRQGALVYELSSELFTDYAHKQRLLRVPDGSTITLSGDGSWELPEGTILAKTFFYPLDMRDSEGPSRVIETRLLIKTAGLWNVATYLWNTDQTDATLLLEGTETAVSWLDEAGESHTTDYAVPHEGECVTCHQSEGSSAFIGPTLRNLNRTITRNGGEQNQLSYLRSEGVLDDEVGAAPTIPNYRDAGRTLEERARAYLDINCAHCHNPRGWDEAAEKELDLRYATPLAETGIPDKTQELTRQLENGEMPFLGTTLQHEEGVRLVLDYVSRL